MCGVCMVVFVVLLLCCCKCVMWMWGVMCGVSGCVKYVGGGVV